MILREVKNIFIKNRLTEGVDYKRYEWLKGDNTAYIEWSANLWINQLHTIIGKSYKTYIGTLLDDNTTNLRLTASSTTQLFVIFRSGTDNKSHIADYNPLSTMPDIVDLKFFINNNKAYCERNGELFTGRNMQSYWNDNVKFRIFGGKMQLLQEYDSVNDKLISSLVPCQLLKPIPSSLDANNKSRAAGECGMYDSISGKFFGNVANSGTFTVEGDVEPETHTGLQQIYQNKLIEGVDYETYDWLKADIPIGTSMMSLPINSRNFEWKRKFIQVGHSTYMYGDTFVYAAAFVQGGVDCSISIFNLKQRRNVGILGTNVTGRLIELIGTEDSLTIDNISVSLRDLIKTVIFETVSNSQRKCIFLTSSIRVDGVTRYVPCQLLKPIPRNLDAQCKERVAGECGMIDLISGKFYGNVASSGTFTVENDNNE